MALSSIALTTVAKVKDYLWGNDWDARLQQPALSVHHNGQAQTSMTVEVRGNSLFFVGNVSLTDELILTNAANDTLSKLAAVINALMIAGEGALIATVLSHGDQLSVDLLDTPATSCFGIANRQVLYATPDRRLEFIIEQATDEIERFLNRGIISRTYTEVYHQQPKEVLEGLVLRQPDVTAVTRVAIARQELLRVQYTGSDPRAWVEVTDSALITRSRSGGTTTTNTHTFAANATLTAMKTAVELVTGWSVTIPSSINANEPTAFLVREGVRDAKGREVQLQGWEDFEENYSVDYEAGIIHFSRTGFHRQFFIGGFGFLPKIQVEYTAGFAIAPDDVENACLELVRLHWQKQGPEARVQPRDLIDDSRDDWRRRLEPYRRFAAWA